MICESGRKRSNTKYNFEPTKEKTMTFQISICEMDGRWGMQGVLEVIICELFTR